MDYGRGDEVSETQVRPPVAPSLLWVRDGHSYRPHSLFRLDPVPGRRGPTRHPLDVVPHRRDPTPPPCPSDGTTRGTSGYTSLSSLPVKRAPDYGGAAHRVSGSGDGPRGPRVLPPHTRVRPDTAQPTGVAESPPDSREDAGPDPTARRPDRPLGSRRGEVRGKKGEGERERDWRVGIPTPQG